MKRSETWLWWAASALQAGTGMMLVSLILFELNYRQVDLAGHLASGLSFSRGLFHRFNDAFFLGTIQNLFYPPLEDLLLGAAMWLPWDPVTAYKAYLIAISVAYLASVWWFARGFSRGWVRGAFLLASWWVFVTDKPGLTYYQGLGAVDILITGLSSQVLAGVFFWRLLDALRSRHGAMVAVWVALIVSSHLVVGMVAISVVLATAVSQWRPRLVVYLAWAAGLSAFFWVPFLAHLDHLTASNIILLEPHGLFVLAVLGLVAAARCSWPRALFAVAVLLVLPLMLHQVPTLPEWLRPPRFHYYRFNVLALLLVLVGLAELADDWRERALRPIALATQGLALVYLGLAMLPRNFLSADDWSLSPSTLSVEGEIDPRLYEVGRRTWVIENHRSVDFGVDSLLHATDPRLQFNKGLFWESSRTNVLLSSYLATLLAPPVVLDHYRFEGYSCARQACYFEAFARDYAISAVLLDPDAGQNYLPEDRRTCWKQLAANRRTPNSELVPMAELSTEDGVTYDWLLVEPSEGLETGPVELIDPAQVQILRARYPHVGVLKHLRKRCRSGEEGPSTVFVEEDRWNQRFAAALERAVPTRATTKLERQGHGHYQIALPEAFTAFVVKLSPLPGLIVTDADGQAVPFVAGFPHVVGVGSGRITLRYEKTPAMWAGYGVSLLTLLSGGLLLIRRRSTG